MINVDDDLKWLIEQKHKAYLAWIALWLACMLGIVNILIAIISRPDVFIPLSYRILVFLLVYYGLVGGTIFSIYRVGNIIKEQIAWANQIEREFLRREILSHRGKLSTLIVDNNGNLCTRNRNFAILIHVAFATMFLLLCFLHAS